VNLAHLHLLLNHFPTVGLGIALGLLLAALLKKSEDLKQASFVVFFLLGLVAIPAYLTGSAAQVVLEDQPNVSQQVMAAHKDAALLALILMEITGLVSWIALWRFRPGLPERLHGVPRWHQTAVLVVAIVTFGLMARAANIGGHIRHPEIRAAATAEPVPEWPRTAAAAAALVLDNPWVWPICEVFHFVGLCLLLGVGLLVNLRLLGFVKGVAFADVHLLLPWAMLGLAINIVTGMLFFLAAPGQYTQNPAFVWKIGLMMIAGVTLLYPTMSEEAGGLTPEGRAPLSGRIIAAGSICLWIGVIFLGRFLPYLGSE
jgi:ABC-type sugar transport system permease subunit